MKPKVNAIVKSRSVWLGFFFLFMVSMGFMMGDKQFLAEEDDELSKTIFVLQSGRESSLLTCVDTGGEKLVALTFDDGPDLRYTPDVLDILKRYDVKATFFIVGENAERYPFLVQRQVEEGHEVENHTYTHPDLRMKTAVETSEEMAKTAECIRELTRRTPVYFRPPRRLYSDETVIQAEKAGYRIILWSICVENQRAKTAGQMARRVIKAVRPGTIILAHDGRLDRRKTIEALPMIIQSCQQKGYQFVTLEELLAAELPDKD